MAQDNDNIEYAEEFIFNSRGTKQFTCRWLPEGKADPRALVFICHGYGTDCSINMRPISTRLAKFGLAVYGIEHEGHGRSDGDQGYIGNFDLLVGDCSDYFKSVCEKPENKKKKRFLYGWSMGGAVALLLDRKDPGYWDGAVLSAPMCKIADGMKPNPIMITVSKVLCLVAPKWKAIPTRDAVDRACKSPEKREEVRANPYIYKGNIPLKTGHEMLRVCMDIEKNLEKISMPLLILHGGDDQIADPAMSKQLYESASSTDKTFNLYPGMWHSFFGEPPENTERVFSDVISWLDKRAVPREL